MITVYSTGCPRCTVLEKKLLQADIAYKICEDKNKMLEMGITSVPVLQIKDGELLNFKEAMKWIDNRDR